MFLKSVYSTGVCVLLALPIWLGAAPEHKEIPLSIGTDAVQKADPALRAFIQQVWSESPLMQGAQAELKATRARAEGADKPLHNPTLELDTEQTGFNSGALTTVFGLSQTIDWSDKREALVQIADQQVLVAEARLRETRQHTAAETLNALVHYSTTRDMQVLVLRSSQIMKAFVDTMKQRQAAGDVAALDVTLAQVAYSEALMEQAATESQFAEAKAALQAVSGLTGGRWPQLPERLVSAPEQADPALLESLPELVVLHKRMEAAKAQINLVRKQGKTDPTVGIRAGSDDSDGFLGLSIEIPLFVRNNYNAEVRAASHDATAEVEVYRDALRRASARLNGALGRYNSTSRAWYVWGTSGQQALQEQMNLLDQMWQAGELTATDFLIQTKQNIDTRATATELMGETWRSAIAWLEASGQVEKWILGENDVTKLKNSGETK